MSRVQLLSQMGVAVGTERLWWFEGGILEGLQTSPLSPPSPTHGSTSGHLSFLQKAGRRRRLAVQNHSTGSTYPSHLCRCPTSAYVRSKQAETRPAGGLDSFFVNPTSPYPKTQKKRNSSTWWSLGQTT